MGFRWEVIGIDFLIYVYAFMDSGPGYWFGCMARIDDFISHNLPIFMVSPRRYLGTRYLLACLKFQFRFGKLRLIYWKVLDFKCVVLEIYAKYLTKFMYSGRLKVMFGNDTCMKTMHLSYCAFPSGFVFCIWVPLLILLFIILLLLLSFYLLIQVNTK